MTTFNDGDDAKLGSEFEDDIISQIRMSGSGDAQQIYASSTGQLLDIRVGTTASPDDDPNPVLKVTRTIDFDAADVTGDGVENATAIVGLCVGGSSSQIQSLGVAGMAKTTSTDATAFENNATGLYGVGYVQGSGTGVGVGGYSHGRTDSSSGKAVGLEVNVYNGTGSDHAIEVAGFAASQGIWMNANGPNRCGVGLTIGNGFGQQFETGINFNGQVNSALTGGVATHSIRDDSSSSYSLVVSGTHSSAAILVEENAGKVVINSASPTGYYAAGTRVEISSMNSTYDAAVPTVAIYAEGATAAACVEVSSQTGRLHIGCAGQADDGLTGVADGDAFLRNTTASKSVHIGGTTSVIEVTQGNALGFFNAATPVTKQEVTGSAGANAALESLLTALAAYGLITDSSS